MNKTFILALILVHIGLITSQSTKSLKSISEYNIDFSQTTVSGISSGGYMAVQLQVANSKFFKGILAIGCGPYWNGKGDAEFAHQSCRTEPQLIVLEDLLDHAKKLSQTKRIDNLSYLKGMKVVLVACEKDTTVVPDVTLQLANQYRYWNANVEHVVISECEHSYPTAHFGNADPLFKGSPFMNICHYDTAFKTFESLMGKIKDHERMKEQNFFEFDQTPYTTAKTGMHEKGHLYVPTGCQNGQKCSVHIAFHGCRQTSDHIGSTFARNTKLNDYAESNNVIILYPQAAINEELGNLNGCWDYWGYTGQDYVEKYGKQNSAVMKILYGLQKHIQDEL